MTGVSVGYARVSTTDQDLSVQVSQLEAAGATKLFSEQVSGKSMARPALDQCLQFLREGDTLIVCRVDRLGRSMRDLLNIVAQLRAKGVRFLVLNQPMFDLNDASQNMMFQVLAAFAEFETNIRAERQREGIERAKAEGRYKGGKQSKYNTDKIIKACRYLKEKHGYGASDCAKHLRMNVRTLYDHTKGTGLWGDFKPGKQKATETFDISR